MKNSEVNNRPIALCIAGFGDNASMFDNLLSTRASGRIRFIPLNLPGFGAEPISETRLSTLADFVREQCRFFRADTIVAHSVASIIASLAAHRSGSNIRKIISLEGNLTAEDAYFSGTAADFDTPEAFLSAFLDRLSGMVSEPMIERYRCRVKDADPEALWRLGKDARAFSLENCPGEILQIAARVLYLYNPVNCPETSIDWLEHSNLHKQVLAGASHWPTIDQPEAVADAIERFLLA